MSRNKSSGGPALDGEGAIALGVLLAIPALAIAIIAGVGWVVYKAGHWVVVKVREIVTRRCWHTRHAESYEFLSIVLCNACEMWKPEDREEDEWEPATTLPKLCSHYYEREKHGEITICSNCAAWRRGDEKWQIPDTNPLRSNAGMTG